MLNGWESSQRRKRYAISTISTVFLYSSLRNVFSSNDHGQLLRSYCGSQDMVC